jgi:hypothetical protein
MQNYSKMSPETQVHVGLYVNCPFFLTLGVGRSGSHSCAYEQLYLVGCNAVWPLPADC